MAASYIRVRNLTTNIISLVGDMGIPTLEIEVGASNYVDIYLYQVQGNVSLCDQLSTWITSGKVSVTRGTNTLTAAQVLEYKFLGDMSKTEYDADDDGLPDVQDVVKVSGLVLKTLNNEKSNTLTGSSTGYFVVTSIVVKYVGTAAQNGNCHITIGTSSGGTQIIGDTTLTGLATAQDTFLIVPTGRKAAVAANATLYVKNISADTSGNDGNADTYIIGKYVA